MAAEVPVDEESSPSAAGGVVAAQPETAPVKEPSKLRRLTSYLSIFFAADPAWLDYFLLVVGTISAAAAGVPFPLMGILFGQLVDDMNGATCAAEAEQSSFAYAGAIDDKVLKLVYVAIGAFFLIYAYVLSWSLVSQRLAQRLRARYVASLLRQPPSFFDAGRGVTAGEVSSRLHGDITAVQTGTSEKVGILIASLSFFITSYVVAFIKQPKLAGMLLSLIPAFLLMSLVGSYFVKKYAGRAVVSIEAASSIASESLSHVAVVQAFSAAKRLEAKYTEHVAIAQKAGIKKAVAAAVQAGLLYFLAYSANALAFWQGSRLVVDYMRGEGDGSTVGQVYTVVFLLVDACVILGNIAPLLPLLGGASSAYQRLSKDIEAQSAIDGTSDEGLVLPVENTAGAIAFRDVSFEYPSRPGQLVLRKINLDFPAGKHTAIVGLSGSGKSTIAALVARLQDPAEGSITLDGHDLRQLNVRAVRSLISLVQQEPSLLDRSILENIALGLVNSPWSSHQHLKPVLHGPQLGELASQPKHVITSWAANEEVAEIVRLVRQAADQADVSSFIDRLEKGYGTSAGTNGGSLLSGGQRQRVALARALVRDPKILVLDEATASLDSASERRIQDAVERIAQGGKTIISIAHRLSTIRNADNIIVMEAGDVVEQGTYDELMAFNGVFAGMARLQTFATTSEGSVSGDSIGASTLKNDVVPSTEKVEATEAKEDAPNDAENVDETAVVKDETKPLNTILKSLVRILRPSLGWLVLAVSAAFIVGCTFSGSGLLFGFTVGALNPCSNTAGRILYLGQFFGGLLFMLAVIELFANFLAWSCFGLISEKLLYAMRVLSFRSLMEQGIEWHQSEGRSPTTLLSIITKDSAAVGGFGGSTVGTVLSILVNFVVAIILSHIIAWKIAIVCLVVVPILLGAGLMQLRMLARYEERHAEAFNKATAVAVEAAKSIRTVAALSLEKEVMGTYSRLVKGAGDEMVRAAAFTNVWLAVSNSTSFLIYAFAYWWGAQLIMRGEYTQTQFFIILIAMLVSAQLWGQMFTLAPEFSRARGALSRIIGVINLGSDNTLQKGDGSDRTDVEAIAEAKPPAGSNRGVKITFDNVSFAYPARPDVPVLDNVSFTIQPGQFVGLVGPSGAGKSTIMSLVQRLYTPTAGTVSLDDMPSSSSSSSSAWRDSIALVPQDPALFDGTVRFNVGLGARPGREATDAEIQEACKLANIHDTIMSLPDGYDTECGPSAGRLSGGQRQRLAIARALVRKPRLLLLDESTSALDAASEAALQEGLDRVAKGTTVLAITHRLHTVHKADVILVVEGGRIVDSGRHAELMERRESYRVNAMQQMLQ
ncbi:Leptomycin B resistance protein pmd1 [Diplogelasinospora grovesii]|uniref:Leptomycin B resistance protein pmd1 n=1 Tax=Diplogelasinospora grovesii TaxID=303347 RepID=A0AAN6N0A0_9PEZI|nr:Leptomycin B resistance protein pmd1 [Diplogelasinospora grovesii]